MEEKEITNPVKAIRAKCLDCCCGSSNEVELCTCTGCALYPFRRGKKVAWSHFALVGEIYPQAPLNDFCKIGCAPAELSSPAARQRIAVLCEYVIDIFSVSGYT